MNYPLTFGKYLLLERINVGGMAEVFKAKAFGVEGFERILAIKRILPNMADDDEFINMFVDEARIAVQLSHASIVQIYELGKFENQYYIAMEYISGKDLRQILDAFRKEKLTFPLPAAAYVVGKICDGLDYAHRRADPTGRPLNVIHRDVSPQNMLVSYEGAVKITDFGIAKAEDRASKTQAGVLKGKFGYMSPEQVRGLEIDHRSDIFAVGILLYEMITGRRLFLGESDFSTLEKVRNAEVIPPTQLNPEVPPELERIMLKALARERDDRYQWASDLHDDLQQFLIENNTIFNAKRLATLLQERYRGDIEAEMQRMEEYMRMPPPTSPEALAAAEEMRGAARRNEPLELDSNEKTMIFESGFEDVATAQTQPGDDGVDVSQAGARLPSETRTGSVVMPPTPSVSHVSPLSGTGAGTGLQAKHVGAIAVAAAIFVSLLVALVWLLLPPPSQGTIVITSTPTDAVEVYLDGTLVGSKTPLTRSDIAVGEHILLARAAGFADRAYRFELVAGNPAVIAVQLERVAPVGPVRDGVVEVISEPNGAAVRIAGQLRGTTPVTIEELDRSQPVIVELSRDGFQTRTETVTFEVGKNTVTLRAVLQPVGVAPGAGSNGRSTPPGATKLETSGNARLRQVEKPVARKEVREVRKEKKAPRASSCAGSGGKLSVMPIGQPDCKVMVGKSDLGIAPFFNKDTPVGTCDIRVTCPSGKKYRSSEELKAGNPVKVVIKPDQWQ